MHHFYVEAVEALPADEHRVRIEFAHAGGGLGKGGQVTLYVDGNKVGEGAISDPGVSLLGRGLRFRRGRRRRGRDRGFSMGMVASDPDPSIPAPFDLDRLGKLSP